MEAAMHSYEKASLKRFLTVYTIALIAIIALVLTLYTQIKIEALRDRVFHELRSQAFAIASRAIEAQMMGKSFKLPKNIDYQLLNKDGQVIAKNFDEKLPLHQEFFTKNGVAYYIDRGAHGHLGIEYIVLKDREFGRKRAAIYKQALLLGMGVFSFLFLIGFLLAREFLRPLKEQIAKLDRFIKDTTHEINTPITTINLATKKILQKGAKPIYLQSLHMAANLISRIYEDLSFITFDKIEQKNLQAIDLKERIEQSILFFTFLIEKKGLRVISNLDSCILVIDPLHIDILIKNILDNAIKYAPAGSILKVELHSCRLTVTNEGKIEDPEKILKRYAREDEEQGGFGIGLDIVSTICKAYGYRLEIQSGNNEVQFSILFK